MSDRLANVYGKLPSQVSKWARQEHSINVWKNVTSALTSYKKPWKLNIEWIDFDFFAVDSKETALERKAEFERILRVHGDRMREHDKIMIKSNIVLISLDLKKFWDEYTNYLQMERVDFLKITNNVEYLKEIIDNHLWDKELVKWNKEHEDLCDLLLNAAKSRLSELHA